jgi:hypothetical protein
MDPASIKQTITPRTKKVKTQLKDDVDDSTAAVAEVDVDVDLVDLVLASPRRTRRGRRRCILAGGSILVAARTVPPLAPPLLPPLAPPLVLWFCRDSSPPLLALALSTDNAPELGAAA